MPRAPRWRRAARVVFALYALVLAAATHWPGLAIEGPVDRSDLFIHVFAFGVWTGLLLACGFLGPTLGSRNLLGSAAISLAYAAADELTQGLPPFHRTVAASDLAANLGGVAAALLAAVWLRRRMTRVRPALSGPQAVR
jgi:hypothetical protein